MGCFKLCLNGIRELASEWDLQWTALPVGADQYEDDEQPDVGEEGEDHGDDEDRVGLYPPGLSRGYDGHADGGDDEEVEGSRPHDETGAQLILLEVIEENPNDGQQDLRRRARTCKYRAAG